MSGVSEAFVEAVGAISRYSNLKPLPAGVTAIETTEWKLAVNASLKATDHDGSPLGPYEVRAEHRDYLVIALLHPNGGMVGGGMPEDEFIEQMKAIAPEQAA
jgi:hypothetical protein